MQMKRMQNMKHALSLLLCMVLIVAMALVTTGCNAGRKTEVQTTAAVVTESAKTEAQTSTAEAETTVAEKSDTESEEITILGEGKKVFRFSVVTQDKTETWFEIHTDEEMVGAALMEVGLLEGEPGPYGLFVKAVNGITADFEKDKVYWAFYVNDAYGMSGVDTTKIEEGAVYSFRIEK